MKPKTKLIAFKWASLIAAVASIMTGAYLIHPALAFTVAGVFALALALTAYSVEKEIKDK